MAQPTNKATLLKVSAALPANDKVLNGTIGHRNKASLLIPRRASIIDHGTPSCSVKYVLSRNTCFIHIENIMMVLQLLSQH